MMQALQQLKPRERAALGFAAVLLLVYLFYAFIYAPLQTARIEKTQEYSDKVKTRAFMKNVQGMGLSNQKKAVMSHTQLLALITADFKKPPFRGFSYQIQQTSTGDIQLAFDQVPYGVMIQWLWQLTNHYAIDLKQVIIVPKDRAGLVECHLSFS